MVEWGWPSVQVRHHSWMKCATGRHSRCTERLAAWLGLCGSRDASALQCFESDSVTGGQAIRCRAEGSAHFVHGTGDACCCSARRRCKPACYMNKLVKLSDRAAAFWQNLFSLMCLWAWVTAKNWAAALRAALQLVCSDPSWTEHMLQCKATEATIVAAAELAFCNLLDTCTGC